MPDKSKKVICPECKREVDELVDHLVWKMCKSCSDAYTLRAKNIFSM